MIGNFTLKRWNSSVFYVVVLFFVFQLGANAATITCTLSANKSWGTAGSWDGSVIPTSADDVIINNTSSSSFTLTVGGNFSCKSIKFQNSGTGAAILSISNSFTLTVINDFNLDVADAIARAATVTGLGTLSVGGNLGVGNSGVTTTVTKSNTLNLSATKINVGKDITIYNNVNGSFLLSSQIVHSNGTVTLTDTSNTFGYLRTYQNGNAASSTNKYTMSNNNATLVFKLTGSSPVYRDTFGYAPTFSAGTVLYTGSGGASIVFPTTYYYLKIDNTSGSSISAATTITNQLDLINGTLAIGGNTVTFKGSNINISNTGKITKTGLGKFDYGQSTNYNLTYSSISNGVPGPELVSTSASSNKLNNLTFSNTTNFNLGSNDIYIKTALILSGNFSYSGTLYTPYLNVTGNSTLTNSGSGEVKVIDKLDVTASKVLNTGGMITLVSTNTGTARVGQVSAGAIVGNVTVERYLSNAKRIWRLMTAPVNPGSGENSVWASWANNGIQDDIHGTDFWGPNNTYSTENQGLYYLPISTHNLRKYNNGWTSVSNTKNEKLYESTHNKAFLIFAPRPTGNNICVGCGNGGENIGYAQTQNSDSTILTSKGALITGDQSYDLSNVNTFSLIGNPFASPIDMSSLLTDNSSAIKQTIWLMDPNIGTTGGYVTWQPGVGYSDSNSQNAISGTNFIQSGQAFFVCKLTSPSSSTITINESHKRITTDGSIFGRQSGTVFQLLRVNLDKQDTTTGNYLHKDACLAAFYDGGANDVDGSDAAKFTNVEETLGFNYPTIADATKFDYLGIEHRAPVVNGDFLPLALKQAKAGTYKLSINTENFNYSGSAYLNDSKLNTKTVIALDGTVFECSFDISDAEAKTSVSRFSVTFEDKALGVDKNAVGVGIIAFPNPASTDGINLNLGNLNLGLYNYKIVNILGQEIQKGNFTYDFLNQNIRINFSSHIKSGWYSIEISDQNESISKLPIIIK